MMDFVAGADIPDSYAAFLIEELQLDGVDTKAPDWSSPILKAAAAPDEGAGGRRRHVGPPGRHPAAAGRHRLHHHREERRRRRHLVREHLSGLPGRQPQPHVFLLLRAQPRLAAALFPPAGAAGLFPRASPTSTGCASTSASRPRSRRRCSTRPAASGACEVSTPDGRREILEANAVITAVGQLNRPRYPDIEGLDTFEGPSFHSARWRHDVDLTGKRVAVIGTGASAFQFVPEIAPKVGPPGRLPAHAALGLPGAELPRRCAGRDEVAARARALLRQMVPLLAVLDADRRLLRVGEGRRRLERPARRGGRRPTPSCARCWPRPSRAQAPDRPGPARKGRSPTIRSAASGRCSTTASGSRR